MNRNSVIETFKAYGFTVDEEEADHILGMVSHLTPHAQRNVLSMTAQQMCVDVVKQKIGAYNAHKAIRG